MVVGPPDATIVAEIYRCSELVAAWASEWLWPSTQARAGNPTQQAGRMSLRMIFHAEFSASSNLIAKLTDIDGRAL
jgi:hypothetical protein